jgi:glycosyltransferase involved in cell wall biosynthesis
MRAAPALITVAIPVRDAEEHIADQLGALATQTYRGAWELVVADNGCTDGTLSRVWDFRDRLPAVRVADATAQKGLNHARNVATAYARGDFLCFCDADDVASPGWLQAMAAASRHADVVAGALEFDALNDPVARALYHWDPPSGLVEAHGFLAYVPGGNCGVWTRIARELRWDESFVFGSSDIEFSWRAQLASCRLHFTPEAVMHQRFTRDLGGLARQFYAYGKSDAALYRRFRECGMPRPDGCEAYDTWQALFAHRRDLAGPREARANWVRTAARKWGRVVGSVRHRALVL